jgi:DNA-3-methyladenine glycosylase
MLQKPMHEVAQFDQSLPVLDRAFFDRPFLKVARELLGHHFVWNGCGGRIVEVEAYAIEGDAACHTATRKSSRLFCQEQPPGTGYVYLNYGMYWLVNVLVRDGILLLRALEPMHGIAKMQERRKKSALRELCSGPGKLGQALGFSGADHGVDFTKGAFRVGKKARVTTDVRIGISKATELPWRFLEKESPWISVGQQIGKP